MTLEELQEKRVVILGLGLNNRALAEYLLQHGCEIVIRDRNPQVKEEFLRDHPEWEVHITWEIQPDITENLRGFDVAFRTPFIPYLSKNLQKAKKSGVEIFSQTRLFFDLCPARIIGITGTKGKGTTATLIHQILQAGYTKGKVYLAGNIGVDPFSFLDDLTVDDLVVLELSSFQTQDLHKSPHVAVLLHVAVDHLDHHQDLAEYREAKASLIRHQQEHDIAIINMDYPEMKRYFREAKARRYMVTRHTPARQSAWSEVLEGEEVVFFQMESELESFAITGRKLLGEHNLENILPAVLVGSYFGVPTSLMRKVIVKFPGLEHRLAHVGTFAGVDFYDDSIATTPESCKVAVDAFPGKRIHLLLGGGDKGANFTEMAEYIVSRCATISFIPGNATPKILSALKMASRLHPGCLLLDSAPEATFAMLLNGIHPHLQSGDVVVLAPAAKSDLPYANYKERGEAFVHAVFQQYRKPTI